MLIPKLIFQISRGDKLSNKICKSCFFAVQMYFGFRNICLQNDYKQRKTLKDTVANSTGKRKKPQSSSTLKKKQNTEYDIDRNSLLNDLRETDDDYEENLLEFFEREQVDIEEEKLVKIENLDKGNVEVEISKGVKIEAEIRQIIERSLTEEQARAENIIIHIQNDDEEDHPSTEFANLKFPIVIETIDSRESKHKPQKSIIKHEQNIYTTEDSYFKGAMSDMGKFEATSVNYIFGFEFCILDGYVFEYRLCKGKVR